MLRCGLRAAESHNARCAHYLMFTFKRTFCKLTAMKTIAMTLLLLACTTFAESKIKPDSRIVFIGDSITGLSINHRDGFNHQMKWALGQTFESNSVPELVSLGGSGQGVATWMNIAKMSLTEERFLDIKGVDVKANLEKKADILIFMLGMNDILCPYVKPTEEDMDRWAADYMKLIEHIRNRANPDITALASITLLTDGVDSPKDIIRKKLNQRVQALTRKHGFIYLKTGEEMEQLLKRGRELDSKFRPTYDFVHPDTLGHTAISVAMLEGLGDMESARALRRKYFESGIFDCSQKAKLAYAVTLDETTLSSDTSSYTINYIYTPQTGKKNAVDVSLDMQYPESSFHSQSTQSSDKKNTVGHFNVKVNPARYQTRLTLTATAEGQTITNNITLPAQWLVAAGIPHQQAWHGSEFKPESDILECEGMLINGDGFDAPLTIKGVSYHWQRYAASINYSGFDNPDSLAWYATTYCNTFDAAYATRWIYSEKERAAQLELGHDTFSSTIALSLWINGAALEPVSLIRSTRQRQYRDINLRKGWNHLLLRSDHTTWQWQHICTLKAVGDDTLEDLRYSIVPKAAQRVPVTGR